MSEAVKNAANRAMNQSASGVTGQTPSLTAVITVHGPQPLLRAFRKRLMDACAGDARAASLTQRNGTAPDHLPFDFSSTAGVPFPELVAISIQYPDCVAVIGWTKGSASGETTIQNGQVKEASREAGLAGRTPQWVELTADGVLQLALALDIARDGILGYCATAEAETWFSIPGMHSAAAPNAALFTIGGDGSAWDEQWRGGQCLALTPPLALTPAEQRALDALSASFRAEWLWYAHAPEEEIIVERQRYQEAGRPVHRINLKSIKLAEHRQGVLSSLAPEQTWIAALLRTTWGQAIS